MTDGRTVCDFAVIRLLPYPDTEEFVNTGVVVACPEQRDFDFRIQAAESARILQFFPKLDPSVLKKGLAMFATELACVRRRMSASRGASLSRDSFVAAFREVVRPRESLFRYGAIGAYLAPSPAEALDSLFAHYVTDSATA